MSRRSCNAASTGASKAKPREATLDQYASGDDTLHFGNSLSWFDAFSNSASSLMGYTVKILP